MNMKLVECNKWLTELGIRTKVFDNGMIGVNRDDMMALSDSSDEDKAYGSVLQTLRKEFFTNSLYWNGKDDDWYFLDTF